MEAQASRESRCREELDRLLASPEFASSRQLQEFLRYTSERAFEGVRQLDQIEIAEAVLGRGRSFNPVEDASVRKVASLARQRLEQYYRRTGRQDGIVVSLPVRSYVPRYDEYPGPSTLPARDSAEKPLVVPDLLPAEPKRSRRFSPALLISLAVLYLLLAAGAALFLWRNTLASIDKGREGTFVITTARGDISAHQADAPPQSVQLGPMLRDFDEVSAALTFMPAQEAQQAGLLIWQDRDHYIQVGRRFVGRNQLTFTLEGGEKDSSTNPSTSVRYDSGGQAGAPLWLAIRKQGNHYQGLSSTDGSRWEEVGPAVTPSRPFLNPRAGIYAFNGRRDAHAIPAVFRDLSTGATFAAWRNSSSAAAIQDGNRQPPSALEGWKASVPCPGALLQTLEEQSLRFEYSSVTAHCNSEWTRPVPVGDWEYLTKLDFFPVPGMSAGIGVRGTKGAVRIARYTSNGASICLIHDGKTFVAAPDLNGSPAVYLRLRSRGGIITGAYSADGDHFHELDARVPAADLGPDLQAGLRVSVNETREGEGSPAVRFSFLREVVTSLQPYR